MFPLVLVFGLCVAGVVGDYFLKLAGMNSRTIEIRWFAVGMVVYALTAFGWFYVMKHMKFAALGGFYAATMVILLTIVGVVYFKESLTVREVAGILAALLSLILLARFA